MPRVGIKDQIVGSSGTKVPAHEQRMIREDQLRKDAISVNKARGHKQEEHDKAIA